jgi:hypothetical protein
MIILDRPIDLAKVVKYVLSGRACIADVFGYRSDLEVLLVHDGMLTLKAAGDSGSYEFSTDIKYVKSVTVL